MNRRIELAPGIALRAFRSDRFKTGCLSINFLRPLCEEEAALNALLPSVLLRGTAAHPDIRSISMLLDSLYGATVGTLVRKKGEVQTWGFYADFIEDAYTSDGKGVFPEILAFLRELLFEPLLEDGLFTESAVEGEKVNLCNTIASLINDKIAYAANRIRVHMLRGEAAAVPRLGTKEQAEAITPASLTAHYRRVLASSRIELFYLGSRDPEAVAADLRALLAPLPRDAALTPVGTEIVRSAGTLREVSEALDVTQGKLVMGFRTGCSSSEPGYPALSLMNAVFGGGMSSKLFRNVRERMSLCYYASSSLDAFKGLMIVNSGIEFDKYETVRDEVLRQLDLIRQGEITDLELEQARSSLLTAFRAAADSPGTLDEFYVAQAITGLSETLESRLEAIRAVTKEEVVEAACRVTADTVYFLKGAEG